MKKSNSHITTRLNLPLCVCICAIMLPALLAGCRSGEKYSIYQYDNGDDYICEGLRRIIDDDGMIGFADSLGNVVIAPQFAFAFPFRGGYAKVTDAGHSEAVDKRGEYHRWVSDSWYYIDKTGTARLKLHSHSTNDKFTMTIGNPGDLKIPIDSLVLNLKNNSDEEAVYGDWFIIQQKDNKGNWKEVPFDEKYRDKDGCINIIYNAVAYILEPHSHGNKVERPWMYGQNINKGTYRIVKDFWIGKYTGQQDTAYVEFEIL